MLYRGLSNESYSLIPTAHRQDEKLNQLEIMKYHPAYSRGLSLPNGSERQVASAELTGLKIFFEEANRQGCQLPHSYSLSNLLFRKYNHKFLESAKEWYTADVVELAALAQHSGFPTRLLDWTYDINTALYFAIRGVVKRLHEDKSISEHYVIWCVDAEKLGFFSDHSNADPPIEFFVPNYSDNPNLRAQSGVLSYYHVRNLDEPFSAQSVDKIVFEHFKNSKLAHEVFFTKLVFPTNSIIDDFRYLRSNGYHAAKLFPGYNGVMRKLEEDNWIQELVHK